MNTKSVNPHWRKLDGLGRLYSSKHGAVICCDALELLSNIPDSSTDLIFLDPPFNLGKIYGAQKANMDKVLNEKYESYMRRILTRAIQILKPGGALYLYHIPKWALRFSAYLSERLEFRHWIAVSMKNGFPRGKRLYPAHYALLYFTKGEPRHFKRPKIDIKNCRSCGESIKDYGGYKKYIKNGVSLSDLWEDISPVRHKKYKHRTSNELPMRILERVVKISGRKNALLVDPFAGSGTSAIAASTAGMRYIVGDRELEYWKLMISRLKEMNRNGQ